MRLMTKARKLTDFAFACGYVESRQIGTIRIKLWKEHLVFHVRAHCSERGRLFWDSYSTLAAARKRFNSVFQ